VVVIGQQNVADVLTAGVARDSDEAGKIEKIRVGARTIDLYGFGEGKF
jgi:4-hydroxy-4-methyl-2-oxoglutarate aldolase